jgi:hypothetical protein
MVSILFCNIFGVFFLIKKEILGNFGKLKPHLILLKHRQEEELDEGKWLITNDGDFNESMLQDFMLISVLDEDLECIYL